MLRTESFPALYAVMEDGYFPLQKDCWNLKLWWWYFFPQSVFFFANFFLEKISFWRPILEFKCGNKAMQKKWRALLWRKDCDDTGMYRTVRSANPTYRERESTRIDQVVDPTACDSETRFKHLSGTQTPVWDSNAQNKSTKSNSHNKPINQ